MSQKPRLSFASDNASGAHPRVLEAMVRANSLPFSEPYGEDATTREALERLRALFGEGTEAWLVFNGTGANITGLSSLLRPHEAVICASTAHVEMDECGALERFTGSRTIPVASADGKLRPEQIEPLLSVRGTVHHAQPKVVLISQTTECGTLYTGAEIRALADIAHRNGLWLYMDGARFANAVAALGTSARAASLELGVDGLSFGGTKNGLALGETVLLFGEAARQAREIMPFARKQGMQLASKMRFLSSQFLAYLEGDLWLENARHANAMTGRLRGALQGKIELAYPSQANALFPVLREERLQALQREFYFYRWSAATEPGYAIARWMTSFETRPEDIDRFAEAALHT